MALNIRMNWFSWLALACVGGLIVIGATPMSGADTSTPEEARRRIMELRAEIVRHDDLYFKKAAPVISDAAYDQLKRELRTLETAWPELAGSADSKSTVGDDRTGAFPSYRHRVRMLSLNKAYTEPELRDFAERVQRQLARHDPEYVVEPKFDGLAISVTYERGQLVRAVTRGDGESGDEVTANARTIRSLPVVLRGPCPDVVELRGEVFIGFEEFARINRERAAAGEERFANPRNLAAGTLKLTDPAQVATRRLEIVFYGYGAWEPAEARPESQWALWEQLREWGVPTVTAPSRVSDFAALWAAVQAIGRERAMYAFPTDGVVVKVNARIEQEKLGTTAQAPAWAIAYKFAPERVETRLRGITWQVGRSGALTPVAELEPVEVGGSTVARATLHNREEIVRRDLRVGDYVFVEKAGEIIPSITGVNLERRTAGVASYQFPLVCPACAMGLDGEMRCRNEACPVQVQRRVEHFAGAAGVGITGLGPVLVEKLVAVGRVKTVADLYRLTRADLLALDGVGEKSATALLAAIERSKRAELWRVINGLGIPQVGESGARALAKHCRSLEGVRKIRPDEPIPGLNQAATRAVGKFWANVSNQKVITDLLVVGVGVSADLEAGAAQAPAPDK